MTNTTVPTDAEIAKLYAEETGFHLDDSPAALLDFVRAVLARWGAPALTREEVRTAAQALVDRWDTPAWKDAEHTGAFIQRLREALAAPPAPEVRVPLSIEEVEAILARWDYAIHGDRVRYIVRETERAHGITAKEPTP